MERNTKFIEGDVVRLVGAKSNPPMVVNSLKDGLYQCRWFNKNDDDKNDYFKEIVLEIVSYNPASATVHRR